MLPDDEFVFGQFPAPPLRRLDASHQPLTFPLRIVEDELDRVEPVAGPLGPRTAAARELLELTPERRGEALDEPRDELATLARREPEASVERDREVDAAADEHATAIRPCPAVATLG